MKLKIVKNFSFAHRGCVVVDYVKGQVVETDDKELVDVSLEEGWATKAKASTSSDAPEDKAEKASLETKTE